MVCIKASKVDNTLRSIFPGDDKRRRETPDEKRIGNTQNEHHGGEDLESTLDYEPRVSHPLPDWKPRSLVTSNINSNQKSSLHLKTALTFIWEAWLWKASPVSTGGFGTVPPRAQLCHARQHSGEVEGKLQT